MKTVDDRVQSHTWHQPVSDVVIFFVEEPPASVVGLSYQVRSVFVSVEAGLPQSDTLEEVVRVDRNKPVPRSVRYHAQNKRHNGQAEP